MRVEGCEAVRARVRIRVRGCLSLYDAIQTGVFHRPVAVGRLLRTGTSGTRQASRGHTAPAQRTDDTSSGARSGPARGASQDIASRILAMGLKQAARGGRGARCRLSWSCAVAGCASAELTVREASVGAGELGSSAGGSLEQEGQAAVSTSAVSASEDMTDALGGSAGREAAPANASAARGVILRTFIAAKINDISKSDN